MMILVIVVWFGVQTITSFSIMDKLSIDNLTTTPDDASLLELTGDGDVTIDTMDGIDVDDGIDDGIGNNNSKESFDIYIRTSEDSIEEKAFKSIRINRTAFHGALVSQNDNVRGIILKQTLRPEPRSFFGLIIIPCK